MAKSQGSLLFAEVNDPPQTLADRYEVSVDTIYAIQRGARKPGKGLRRKIFEDKGIDEHAWDRVPALRRKKRPSRSGAPPSEPSTARDQAELLREELERIQGELQQDDSLSTVDRLNLLRKCSDILAKIGKLTGHTLTEREIFRSAAWRRLRDALVRALEPYPDAMASVESALRALE